ncbi:MAG: hypothetical protein A2087_12605 [Spirochaetes bacterium GWD1_61_31]|nr:MAG: hypothetical protein A2Y37_11405 [Spirochaetes bacterium GWB1_60_80]OHD33024.1 MAG: hypothetical protein A2004_07300 [Spirochaetes bacterium GWC1_61_12]OHD38357.1 MAG: hypothetical protein A2087_12605 [Spirochaetes bacterium GWD1_61_31]OHD43376.1 MAG: hypothetical protein A2Y35_02175 [Spirochaetes bacterium GWE1_60_18]OHD58907.1 MAG: hypothetical protein A2Y32_10615 [Spirochaetes bacterium GWF1_60_12]HAP44341.1 hypothetical protein [Spirochaetaceae bacterium]
MFKRITALILTIGLAAALAAQDAGTSRADARALWENSANPASWGLSDAWYASGVRISWQLPADMASLDAQDIEVILAIPLLNYHLRRLPDGTMTHDVTSVVAVGDSLSIGYRTYFSSSEELFSRIDYGLLWRPNSLLSLGFTVSDPFADDAVLGLGLALRPLAAFWPAGGHNLTVSSDAVYSGGAFSMESIGVRLGWDDRLSLRSWYSFPGNSFGLSLAVTAGLGTFAVDMPELSAPPLALRVSSSVQLVGSPADAGATTGFPLVGVGNCLLVDGRDIIALTPSPSSSFFRAGSDYSFDDLVRSIYRAAEDRAIAALVLVDPPAFDTARLQELATAIAAFQAADKPVYVYADNLETGQYSYLAAAADYLVLDPNGSLGLTDAAWGNFYFRQLLENIGINFYSLKSHDTKTAGNPFTEYGVTAAEQAMQQRLLSGRSQQYYLALDNARPDLADGAAALFARGPYLIPGRALDAGLVDGLLYREEFDDWLEERHPGHSLQGVADYLDQPDLAWGVDPFARTVAVVHLSGNIVDQPGVAGASIGFQAAELLASLREDATVAGIILRVDSGGGAVMASDRIAREVRLTVAAGKPVYVSMADYAASGGYYIAAPATRIWAEPGTLTGSIGVLGLSYSATGLLEKLGVNFDSIEQSGSSNFGNPFLPVDEGDLAVTAEWIEHVYGRFVAVVAEGRGLDPARVDELGRGQVWLGSEALENGLVDELGGLEAVRQAMRDELGDRLSFVDLLPGSPTDFSLLNLFMVGNRLDAIWSLTGLSLPADLSRGLRVLGDLEELGTGCLYLAPEYLWRD